MENRSETVKNYGSDERTLITDIPANSRVGEVAAEARRNWNRQDTATLLTVKRGINQLLFFSLAPLSLSVCIFPGTTPEHKYRTQPHPVSLGRPQRFWPHLFIGRGPGSSVGYELDGSGKEFRWGRNFPYLSRSALGPTQNPVHWVPGLSRS